MKWSSRFSVLILLSVVALSCHKDHEETVIFDGSRYFPLKQDSWIIYKIDSVLYSPFGTDTTSWFIKEVVDTVYTDTSGMHTAWLKRYKGNVINNVWNQDPSVWTASLGINTAEKTEENIRYIKLQFPMESGLKWNGNALNGEPEQIFIYKSINKAGNIGNFVFDSLATVIQQDFSTLISKDFSEEIYAIGIGCVYIHKEHLSNLLAMKTGYIYKAQIVQWSN